MAPDKCAPQHRNSSRRTSRTRRRDVSSAPARSTKTQAHPSVANLDFLEFVSILLVLKFLRCNKSIGLAHDEKMLVRTISPRNRAVGVGKRPETGGEVQTRSAVPPNSPSKSAAKREKRDRTHRNPTLGAGVGSLGKATYSRDNAI